MLAGHFVDDDELRILPSRKLRGAGSAKKAHDRNRYENRKARQRGPDCAGDELESRARKCVDRGNQLSQGINQNSRQGAPRSWRLGEIAEAEAGRDGE
jgi:hypothetical protein